MSRVFSQIAYGTDAYHATLALRYQILREPLGLKFSEEDLAREHGDFHLACHENGQLVACLVLSPQSPADVKMRQVAVAPHAQRKGIGRALSLFAEEFGRQHGFSRITLHARLTAVAFYEKLGYERIGEEFEEVTIRHWAMQKQL
jgi:ribosomal protein S18 acetylase RimI-like enzyme